MPFFFFFLCDFSPTHLTVTQTPHTERSIGEVSGPESRGKDGVTRATSNLFQNSNRSQVTASSQEWGGLESASFSCTVPQLECLAGRQAPFPPHLLSEQHEGQAEKDKWAQLRGRRGYHGNKQPDCYLETGPPFLLLLPPSQHTRRWVLFSWPCILGVGTIILFWQFPVTLEWAALHFNLTSSSRSFLRNYWRHGLFLALFQVGFWLPQRGIWDCCLFLNKEFAYLHMRRRYHSVLGS